MACLTPSLAQPVFSADLPAMLNNTPENTSPAVSGAEPSESLPASIPAIAPAPVVVTPAIPADNPIGAILLTKQMPLLLRSDFSRDSDSIVQIYANNNFQALWLGNNRSEKNLNDLLGILSNANKDALNSANYDVERLKQLIADHNQDPTSIASRDIAITVAWVRFLHDLRQGQVDPRDIQYPVHIAPKPTLDLPALIKQHLASQTLAELSALYEPKNKQYQKLKQILTSLRQLPSNEYGEFKISKALKPGEHHPQIEALRQRLSALGVYEHPAKSDNTTYDSDLVSAVKKVQQQQGLKTDGIIGGATAALFTQSSSEKIEQIELAMERARWIPDTSEGPMIVVNIPAFQLWAFNSVDDQNPLNMRVIVGKAPDNKTPVLWEEMKYLEFMPYWNIPKSILEKEIWPKVANNEGYLASQEIELIRHQNSDLQGGGSYIRARQRPGKKNPLGRVKFVFPNKADVYLHDTPGHAAFSRQKRDLSHGCVRVSEPEKLAEFVLADQEGWDRDKIKQAMSGPKTRHVTLKRSVPVLFYYATTFVDPDNQLRFYPDVYGQDEALKKALIKLQAPINSNATASNQIVVNKAASAQTAAATP